MDFEIPHDLIKQAQISIRKEAKIPNYDPDATSLRKFSSVEESLAATDSSSEHLKCKHCKGRLLRGVQSMICVFCGKEPNEDVPRDAIKFRNMIGYRWLLDALDVDGSEIVAPPIGSKESSRGQGPRRDDRRLSDLLDLEIRWPSETERFETGFSSETSDEDKSVLKRLGVQLDDLFTDAKVDNVANVSEMKPVDNVGSGASQGHGNNLSFFENAQPAEMPVRDSDMKTDSSFTGWDADFEFAPRKGAVLTSKEPVVAKKEIDATEKSAVQSAKSISLFENVEHSQSDVRPVEDEPDDGFADWDAEFQSAGSINPNKEHKSVDPFPSSEFDLSAHMDTVFGSGMESNSLKVRDNTTTSPSTTDNLFQDDIWSNFNSVVSPPGASSEMTVNAVVEKSAENEKISSPANTDWIQNDQRQTSSIKESNNKAMDEDDDAFDSWSDFTSSATSASAVDPSYSLRPQNVSHTEKGVENEKISSPTNTDWIQNDQWKTSSIKESSDKAVDKGDDAFDSWNDFTSSATSASAVDPSYSLRPQNANHSLSSEINLFASTNNTQALNSGSSSQLDFFQELSATQSSISEVSLMDPEASVIDRMVNGKTNEQGNIEEIPKAPTPKATNAESLISQMHDLSFMLDSHLSTPKK